MDIPVDFRLLASKDTFCCIFLARMIMERPASFPSSRRFTTYTAVVAGSVCVLQWTRPACPHHPLNSWAVVEAPVSCGQWGTKVRLWPCLHIFKGQDIPCTGLVNWRQHNSCYAAIKLVCRWWIQLNICDHVYSLVVFLDLWSRSCMGVWLLLLGWECQVERVAWMWWPRHTNNLHIF